MQLRCVCVEENIFLLCIYIGNEPTYHNSWFTSFFFLHVFDYHNINKSIHDIHSVTHIQLDSLIVCVFHVQVLCMHEYSKLQTFPHSVLWQLIAPQMFANGWCQTQTSIFIINRYMWVYQSTSLWIQSSLPTPTTEYRPTNEQYWWRPAYCIFTIILRNL